MANKNNIATLWKDEEYTIVPNALYQRCKQLNEATAMFYCRLMDDFLNETLNYGKAYFPRTKELAIRFRVDEKTIKSRMKTLVGLGLVIQTPNPGYANFLEVVDFRSLDILDDTDVKAEIAEHRGQRKVEREQQRQSWIAENYANDLVPDNSTIEVVQTTNEIPIISIVTSEDTGSQDAQIYVTPPTPINSTLSDKQIAYYCSITKMDEERVKEILSQDTSASQTILEVIGNHSQAKAEEAFFKNVATKADPKFKGNSPFSDNIWGTDAPF